MTCCGKTGLAWLACVLLLLVVGGTSGFTVDVRLHDAVSTVSDDLVCTAVKLDKREAHIVRLTPHAQKTTAHHMMLYGCKLPNVENYTENWRCPEFGDAAPGSVCMGGTRQILYAWALNAKGKTMPPDVGIRVGGDTGINYLVVQLHYAHKFEDGVTDNSGYTLELTHDRPKQQVGYLVLGTWGHIPPQQMEYRMETYCDYSQNFTAYPIAYRTHSHLLGVVTSGYRIRDRKWAEIGRMSPQLPQAFYPPSTPGLSLRPGDMLAGRCTMNSMARNTTTKIWTRNEDEMCNFYIMFSTPYMGTLHTYYCFKDADKFKWSDVRDVLGAPPPDASSLVGVAGAEAVRKIFNMAPRRRSVISVM